MSEKQYLKMADVITGDVVHICKDLFDGDGNLLDSVGLAYVAHAINSHDELVAENERLREELDATLGEKQSTSSISDGWQLVPVEPTPEMLSAAVSDVHSATYWGVAYRSMLSAAPKHDGSA